MWKWIVSIAVLALVAGGVWRLASHPGGQNSSSSHVLVPVHYSELQTHLKGHKLTLLNLWASWCGPCKEEFPDLLKLRREFSKQDLQVVFVSLDQSSEYKDAEDFLKEQEVDFQTYVAADPDEIVNGLGPQFVAGVPASFLFDRDGHRVDSWQGATQLPDLEAKIEPILIK